MVRLAILFVLGFYLVPGKAGAGIDPLQNLCEAGSDFTGYQDSRSEQIVQQEKEDRRRKLEISISERAYDEALILLYFTETELSEAHKKNPFAMQVDSDARLLMSVESNDLAGVRAAIKSGANPNVTRPADGEISALMMASRCGYQDIASYLIDHGAAIDLRSYSTALYQAVMNDHLNIVKLLLEKGADPDNFLPSSDAPTRGRTPLMAARSPEVACILLRFGANPNAIDQNGNSVLDSATAEPEIMKVLLGAGADVKLRVDGGLSIIEYMDKIDAEEVRDILRDHKKYENKSDCRPDKPRLAEAR